MIFTNKTYDVLKHLIQIVLPAIGTLYFSLSGLWNLPAAEAVVGTIVILCTFLGTVLGISSSTYAKSPASVDGDFSVTQTEDGLSFALALDEEPENLISRDKIVFRVINE